MSEWSDKFNQLPFEIRHIGAMCGSEMRINQLKIEKERLTKRYKQSIDEINGHIKNLENWIKTEGNKNSV